VDLLQSERRLVLVAEDDPADLLLIKHAAERTASGPRFVLVRGGEEVLAYLQGGEPFADREKFPYPDLVLLDLHMPKMGGLEVVQWIKSQHEHSALRVVVWSDSDYHKEIEEAKNSGAERVARRPKSIEDLEAFLHSLV
jgi:CheY-like chemotaxis protein